MKKCFKCDEVKSLDDFYKHSGMGDRHLGKCKVCTRADVREHRAKNDSVREYDRRRYQTPKRKEHGIENVRRWRLKYPDRYRAHNKLNNSLRDGKILKPENCGVCGGAAQLHAHHHDYAKPLDVVWLCVRCHALTHAEEKRIY